MANKYLLGLKRYLMRTVSVCTSKLSRLGSVYKLTKLTDPRAAIFASSPYCEAWQSHDIIQLCKTETKLLFTWFNFVISPYAWLHVTCIHWKMSASWPGKMDDWQNVLCSYQVQAEAELRARQGFWGWARIRSRAETTDHSRKLASAIVCRRRRSGHMTRSSAWLISHILSK